MDGRSNRSQMKKIKGRRKKAEANRPCRRRTVKPSQTGSNKWVGDVARPHPDLLPLGEGKAIKRFWFGGGVPVIAVVGIPKRSLIGLPERWLQSNPVKPSQTWTDKWVGDVARPHPDLIPLGEGKAIKRFWFGGGVPVIAVVGIPKRSLIGLPERWLQSNPVKPNQTWTDNWVGEVARPHPDLLPLGEGKAIRRFWFAGGVPVIAVVGIPKRSLIGLPERWLQSNPVKPNQTGSDNWVGDVARPHPDLLPLGEGKAIRRFWFGGGVPVIGVVGIPKRSLIGLPERWLQSNPVKPNQTWTDKWVGEVARPHPDLLPLGEGKAIRRFWFAGGVPVIAVVGIPKRSLIGLPERWLQSNPVKPSQTWTDKWVGDVARPHPDLLPLGEGKAIKRFWFGGGVPVIGVVGIKGGRTAVID